nr:MAG: rep protein [Cressdnaviricota sp.]
MEDTCTYLKENGVKKTIMVAPHMYMKYANNMEKLSQFYCAAVSTFRNVVVNVLVGPPGCGKTRSVWDLEAFDDVYPLTTYGKGRTWFQGYFGEKVLLIDDFNGQIEYTELLRLLDGYKMYVETKGGSALAQWTTVYITSNYPWRDWYAGNYNLDALARRITNVKTEWPAAAAAAAADQ